MKHIRMIIPRITILGILLISQFLGAQEKSFHIEDWEKRLNKRQPPVKIMDAIGVKQGMIIGEVGAGTGRMTMWLASRIGDTGKVYANDINKRSLGRLRERSKRDGFENIEIIIGEEENPKLPANALDIAFMINVYHHLDNPVPLIRNILPSLKLGGFLAIVECDPDKVTWGKEEGCTGKKDMAKELDEAGFEIVRIETFLNEDNIYIAKPKKGTQSEIQDNGDEDQKSPVFKDNVFGLSFKFNSQSLGEAKTVFIHLPESYEEGSNRYPVIYILDGGHYFEPFAGMVKYLNLFDMIPEMIVVAIRHGDRFKEFTYTKANEKTGDWPTSGGAESFQKFLSEELIPYIDVSYRTHPFRILVGHSLAGLFAVETLSRSPHLFQATIALSPSLYWNQFEWLKKAESFLSKYDSLKHFLFISGEKKDEEETGYLDKFKDLVAAKGPKGFSYEYRCFPEEDHASVAFPGLYIDLKQLFQGWRFPGEAWEKGPDKVKEHFQSLSERFGFPVPITEEFLNGHAFHGLQRHDAPDEAIQLFKFCLSLYPESDGAYEGMGESYEKKGMKEKAVEFYQKALELNPDSKSAREKLNKLKKKIPF